MRNNKEFVTVELRNGLPVRIFLSRKLACMDPRLDIAEMRRGAAVRIIRQQVVEKAAGKCARCGRPIGDDGEMHEQYPRGMTNHVRGEISVENSIYIHPQCHRQEHANRSPQWRKRV